MVVRSAAGRRERAREQARRDILEAAAGVFAEKGYAGATLADLAEAAGYAAPSLYRYFESKEEIFRSLVERFLHDLDAAFDVPVDREAPLEARLTALLHAQSALSREHEVLMPVLSTPIPDLHIEVAGHRVGDPASGLAHYRARFLGWLKKNTSPDELRLPRELVATAFASLAFGFHLLLAKEKADLEAHVASVVDLAVHGFGCAPSRRPHRASRS